MQKSRTWLSCLALLTLAILAGLLGVGSRGPRYFEPTPAPTVAKAPEKGRKVVRLTLRSPRSRYRVGEPVDLRIELTNVSDQTFQRWDRGDEYLDQIFRVYYSHDGNSFRRYLSGVGAQLSWELPTETYHPGDTKHYRIQVLYQREAREHLALAQPGRYRFKVAFPLPGNKDTLDIGKERGILMAESNTIEVTLVEPLASDDDVLALIRQPEYLYLLQTGWAGKPEDRRGLRLVEMLENHPATEYARTLRNGLALYYTRQLYLEDDPARLQEAEFERVKIRQVTGITKEALFPDDRRLDVEFSYTLEEKTPFPDVIQVLSESSGVPLEVSQKITGGAFEAGSSLPSTLRAYMKRYRVLAHAYWEQRDDGYYLGPLPFPDDNLYGVDLLAYYPDSTPLGEVLRFVSKKSNRSFTASDELNGHGIQITSELYLPTLMLRLAKLTDATWIRRGEGYYLTREPEKFEQDPDEQTKSDSNP